MSCIFLFRFMCLLNFYIGQTFIKDSDFSVDRGIEVISFEMVEGLLFLEGEIDGIKGHFILDNGAPGLILNRSVVKPSDSLHHSGLQGMGATGTADISMYTVKNMHCQNWRVCDTEVPVMDLSHIERKVKKKFIGLIGYDLLKNQTLAFDYKEKKLYVCTGSQLFPKGKLLLKDSLRMQLHLPVITMAINNKQCHMGVDCGAAANLLPLETFAELESQCSTRKEDTLTGADNNQQKIFNCVLSDCSVKNILLNPMKTIFSEGTISSLRASNIIIDGIVGYEFLKQFYTVIDFRNQSIFLYSFPSKK